MVLESRDEQSCQLAVEARIVHQHEMRVHANEKHAGWGYQRWTSESENHDSRFEMVEDVEQQYHCAE
jgi:hypothetical protein